MLVAENARTEVNMTDYLKYLHYVLRHKWFVFIECCRYGLFWQGITHDISKFLPSEFIPYANFFYGHRAPIRRDSTGYYKPTETGDQEFDYAWFLHQKRNKHHWQYWVFPDEGGKSFKVVEMPDKYQKEMLCDWLGAGMAQGTPDSKKWYDAHKDQLVLHSKTRAWIEEQLRRVI